MDSIFSVLENSSSAVRETLDIEEMGQVFTPSSVVNFMISGIKYQGRVLEPSCGDGAFLGKLRGKFSTVAIELDSRHCPFDAKNIDFFSYPITQKFDTIIGNPPYVRYQDIAPSTWNLLRQSQAEVEFDDRSNLYLFFIEKAVRHLKPGGELIFITPRDFLKATSAVGLNRWLYKTGTITHAIELGDARVFSGAVPNCLIWRFERDNFSRTTFFSTVGINQPLTSKLLDLCNPDKWPHVWERRSFTEHGGHLLFTRTQYPQLFSSIASVKVGAVSGDDAIFANEKHGTVDFVCSATAQTGKTRRMIWNPLSPHPMLFAHKERLLARKIRKFDERNWWQWGRGYPQNEAPRVYVNTKTRNVKPFFLNRCNNFDGSVMAVFPKNPNIDLVEFCNALNNVDWKELGFVCDGRFLFSQRSLENAPLPSSFKRFGCNRC